MNTVITTLIKSKDAQERTVKQAEYELKAIEDNLNNELNKETRLLDQVLKHNLIEIINMIHKRGLKCFSVNNAETIWDDTIYKVSDGNYFANIIAKDGKIVKDLSNINNDGGGKRLYEKVEDLLIFDIIPFCEKEKIKYLDKVQ